MESQSKKENLMSKHILFLCAASCILLFINTACTHKWETYVVKAGNHSSNDISLPLINVDRIEFRFRADSSWYYRAPVHAGWNKIRGISHGHHHENSSARLAYQCLYDTMLVVGAYCYIDGISPQVNQVQKAIIDTIQPGIDYHCIISRENGKYSFRLEDKIWTIDAGQNINWGYKLNPYIGGEFTLDHDWIVEIKDVE